MTRLQAESIMVGADESMLDAVDNGEVVGLELNGEGVASLAEGICVTL